MKRLRHLSLHIEMNRQRLAKAIRDENDSAIKSAQAQLTVLQTEFFEAARKELGMRSTDLVLVFSDQDPDGTVMSQLDYMRRVRLMSETDLNTHTAVPVDETAADALSSIVKKSS